MDMKEYVKLQDTTIQKNKESYYKLDGITYINVVNCDTLYWNATAIIEFLISDMKGIDNNLNHLSFNQLSKLLSRVINRGEIQEIDKKVKDWIIRNNRSWSNVNNPVFNKMIRNNYVFYFENKHGILYK